MHIYVYACMIVRVKACIGICLHMCALKMYMFMCMYACMYMCIHVSVHVCMFMNPCFHCYRDGIPHLHYLGRPVLHSISYFSNITMGKNAGFLLFLFDICVKKFSAYLNKKLLILRFLSTHALFKIFSC